MPDKYAVGSSKSTRAVSRDNKREERRRERATRPPCEWESVDPTALLGALVAVSRDGGALRMGLSRDGGAFAFGIYGDGEPYTEYVGATEDVNEYLRELARHFDALTS